MFLKNRQQAWIGGLPGLDKEGGILCEALPFSAPKADKRSLNFTLFGSKELVSNLQSLSRKRTILPKLSIVVRTDAAKELDNQYLMTEALVDTILPVNELVGAQGVNIIFNSILAKMGVSMNPGAPVNCPIIQPTGVNTGWIFGLPGEDAKRGIPIKIVDFTPPHYNRRLVITLEKQISEIQNLVKVPIAAQELILVLPDRSSQRYVEFKLRDAKATLLEDEQHVAFKSDMIEYLTG